MAKRYVKAYYDWIEQTSALSDAEKGHAPLFDGADQARPGQFGRAGKCQRRASRQGLCQGGA